MHKRQYTLLDQWVMTIDKGLRTLLAKPDTTARPYPAQDIPEAPLTSKQRRHAAGLMRVNHSGEVCAQALYHGQAISAHNHDVKLAMQHSAQEESDHLDWCATRLQELNSHKSYLNPLWYIGSFSLGVIAGTIGDKWSLGFVVETEHQVVEHLQSHFEKLPSGDQRSRKIVEQMQIDEAEHAKAAIHAGAASLPTPIKHVMALTSTIMTTSSYWV